MSTQHPAPDGSFRFQGGTADIDPQWIDIDTLKTWLWTCNVEHGPECSDTTLFESGGPRWLIDVVKGCLVPAEAHDCHVALSYVWGQTETVRTTKDILVYLLEEGSIFAHMHLLPRTIRDTICLVKLLDIRYLWVDCLCIVQDDVELKHAQIQEMGSVYAQAYVTIIAANGWDANHGLRGIRNVTEPRHVSRYVEENFYESLQPHSSIWYTRGWTFQEMVFARRKIMFHYQVAVWECQCATWHEATETNVIPSITNDTGPVFQVNRWGWRKNFSWLPDVRQYIEMVREYNHRELTFPADGLHAIAGLITVWNRSFHGGFICGLPQMFFDEALLWQPRSRLGRRIPTQSSSEEMMLPSWSWVGWEGEIESSQWAHEWDCLSLQYYKGAVIWKLNSTVAWSHGDICEQRQPIDPSSHRYRRCSTDNSIPLPPGWSRKPVKEYALFVHRRLPSINFGYPIPLPKRNQQNAPHILSKFLFGQTRRGHFKEDRTPNLHSRVPSLFGNRRPNNASGIHIFLEDDGGAWAGTIQLHDNALFSSSTNSLLDDSSKLELVSISAGTATCLKDPHTFRVSQGDGVGISNDYLFEFYNVLWIEWKEGVAYRKGLGRVIKEAWERQATEWIDLALG